jgi:hypothetical protein
MKKFLKNIITVVILAFLTLTMYFTGTKVNDLLGFSADHSRLYFFGLGFFAWILILFLLFVIYLMIGTIIHLKNFKLTADRVSQ